MKNLGKLLLVAGLVVASSSCVKSRTCTCTTTTSSGQTSTSSSQITGVTGVNSSKKSQQASCEAQNYSDSYGSTTCTLSK